MHRATHAAGVVAVVAMVVLVVGAVVGNSAVGTVGLLVLVLVPAARNIVIFAVGERADRPWAVLGLALLALVTAGVFLQR